MSLSSLPPLEESCSVCGGKKHVYNAELDGFLDCISCNGSGFSPTEEGRRVLLLLRHNTRVTVSAELCVSTAA